MGWGLGTHGRPDVRSLVDIGQLCLGSQWGSLGDRIFLCGFMLLLYWTYPMQWLWFMVSTMAPSAVTATVMRNALKTMLATYKKYRVYNGVLRHGVTRGLMVVKNPSERRQGSIRFRKLCGEIEKLRSCAHAIAAAIGTRRVVNLSSVFVVLSSADLAAYTGRGLTSTSGWCGLSPCSWASASRTLRPVGCSIAICPPMSVMLSSSMGSIPMGRLCALGALSARGQAPPSMHSMISSVSFACFTSNASAPTTGRIRGTRWCLHRPALSDNIAYVYTGIYTICILLHLVQSSWLPMGGQGHPWGPVRGPTGGKGGHWEP